MSTQLSSRPGSPEPSGDEVDWQPSGGVEDPMAAFLQSTRTALDTDTDSTPADSGGSGSGAAGGNTVGGADMRRGSQLPQVVVDDVYTIPPLSLRPGYPLLIKKLKDVLALDDEASTFVDLIGNATSYQEIMLIQGAGIAKLNQQNRAASTMEKSKPWVVSQALRRNLRFNACLFLLSNKLSSYRGKNIAQVVLKFMRHRGVADLPSDTDHAGKDTLYSTINDILSNFRCEAKKKVALSLTPNSPMANIADLTAAILSPLTGAVPTLEMFARIAFLRFHVRNYGHLDEQLFWRKVDYTLKSWTKAEFPTAEKLNGAFTKMYKDDEIAMGCKASESTVVAVDLKDIPAWMHVLNDLGQEVRNSEVLGQDPMYLNEKVVVQRPAKRRRGGGDVPSSDM